MEAGNITVLYVPQSSRERDISTFRVGVADWMMGGFNFKCVSASGEFETDRSNRVWRPADGAKIYFKTGQISLRSKPLALKPVTVSLIYPKSLGVAPSLELRDRSDSFSMTASPVSGPADYAADPRFNEASYAISIYPRSLFLISFAGQGLNGKKPFQRPMRIVEEDSGSQLEFYALLGYDGWLASPPAPTPVSFVFHPRAAARVFDSVKFHVGIGQAPAHATVAASPDGSGAWRAATSAFTGIPSYADVETSPPSSDDKRVAGLSRRAFMLTGAASAVLHTADGRGGFSTQRAAAPSASSAAAAAAGRPPPSAGAHGGSGRGGAGRPPGFAPRPHGRRIRSPDRCSGDL